MVALRAALAVMAVVFGGTGVVFALLGARRWREQARLRGWEQVDALLTSVELEAGKEGTARITLRYQFDLFGQRHEGGGLEDAIASFMPIASAEALGRRFVAGTRVQVRVDRADPTRSMLVSDMAPRATLLFIATGVFLVLAAAFVAGAMLVG